MLKGGSLSADVVSPNPERGEYMEYDPEMGLAHEADEDAALWVFELEDLKSFDLRVERYALMGALLRFVNS